MKRTGNLFPVLISEENILQAIEVVNKTHKWCSHHRLNQTVVWVERTKTKRVEELRDIIIRGFKPSPSRYRIIYDQSSSKNREIYIPKLWPDQYIHHALIQVIQEPIMRGMDYWCSGSIPDRGTAHGIKAIKRWMEDDPKGTKYCAELDIHHFYQSLKPEIVMIQMRRIIKDELVLKLIQEILRDGVPIGSYCSQWFANAVLQPLDHLIREELEVTHYVRYMDNFTLFSGNKKKLHKAVRAIGQWLNEHDLALKSNWQVFPVKARMPNAMGYRYGRGFTLPRKRTLLRFKRACSKVEKRLSENREPTFRQACSILSRVGWLQHSNCYNTLQTWLEPIGLDRLKDIVRNNQRLDR